MILVRITMNVIPEKQKELIQTLISLMASSKKEDGYLCFEIFSDIEDMNVLNLISEWKTRKKMNLFFQSKNFTVLLGTRSLLFEPFTIRILTISATEGIDYVTSLRKSDEN